MAVQTISVRQNLGSALTTRGPSPAIWWDCPEMAIRNGEIDGIADGDDFTSLLFEDTVVSTTVGNYREYIDTSNTIRLVADTTTTFGGQLALITDATDNDGPVIVRMGPNAASSALGPYMIGNSVGASFPLWFEARIKVASIADDVTALFCGLFQNAGAAGAAANDGCLEDNTGDIVDSKSCIGFRTKHVNSGTAGTNALLDFVYQDSANTAPTVSIASVATLVADTFIKVGFKYDPKAPAANKIKCFINNIEQSTYITTALIDAAAFPENDALAFTLCQKNGSSAGGTLTIDWWKCIQAY